MYTAQEKGTWNWEMFEKICGQIKAAGYTPVADTSGYLYSGMLIANGTDIFTQTNTSVTSAKFSADSDAGKVVMDTYKKWFDKGYVKASTSGDVDKTNFIQGKVGFYIDYLNRIYAPDGGYATMKDDHGFITIPQGPNGKKSIAVKNWFFGLTIPVGVKDSEIIADVLSSYCEPLLTSSENAQLKTAQYTRYTKDKGSLNTLKNLNSKAVFTPSSYFQENTMGKNGWLNKYVPEIRSGKKTAGAAFAEVKSMYEKSIADIFKKK
ncbi:MAG: hypothetical protein IKK24_03845 [Clostridia bacterium]|nr:hypothetical protein [Clostridia bacterium]